jgi:Tropinone reductase 1
MANNLESAFHLSQLCRPLLAAAGSSCILFNSSVSGGPLAMFSGTLYAMSKAVSDESNLPWWGRVLAVDPQCVVSC